jgi:ADP-ribose pyrophosphatase YjhB (NUDIX family)
MRRRRRIALRELPRVLVGGAVQFAGLFSGRYERREGAHVLARDAQGRILVVRTTYLGPGWMLPGGHVERGETPHDAAVRETLEETGLNVTIDRLVLIDASRPTATSFVFRATVVGGELEPQFGEIAEAGWLRPAEIAADSPGLAALLDRIADAENGFAYLGL